MPKEILYLVQATDQEGQGKAKTVLASFHEHDQATYKKKRGKDSRYATTEIVVDPFDVVQGLLRGLTCEQLACLNKIRPETKTKTDTTR